MLTRNTHYIQIALNASLSDAEAILRSLPLSNRILIEAGTPFIKRYGTAGISQIYSLWSQRVIRSGLNLPYVVADMKTMDRGENEVVLAKESGAAGVVALGSSPTATLNAFIASCKKFGLDSFIDMMNVDKPYQVLRAVKQLPDVVLLHRGVDEEKEGNTPLPIHMINKIKGSFNVLIGLAGGDESREIQSAVFNGADIVVLWKQYYRLSNNVSETTANFLATIK